MVPPWKTKIWKPGTTTVRARKAGKSGFGGFAFKRIAVGILLTFAVLWITGSLMGLFDGPESTRVASVQDNHQATATHGAPSPSRDDAGHGAPAARGTTASPHASDTSHGAGQAASFRDTSAPAAAGHGAAQGGTSHEKPAATHAASSHDARPEAASQAGGHATDGSAHGNTAEGTAAAGRGEMAAHTASSGTHQNAPTAASASQAPPAAAAHQAAAGAQHATHGAAPAEAAHDEPTGVAFINATMRPLAYELNERFWGWRPNDILDFTDNVNNFQLGVLEVTRRTVVSLTERISRTGTTAAFDKNLEKA